MDDGRSALLNSDVRCDIEGETTVIAATGMAGMGEDGMTEATFTNSAISTWVGVETATGVSMTGAGGLQRELVMSNGERGLAAASVCVPSKLGVCCRSERWADVDRGRGATGGGVRMPLGESRSTGSTGRPRCAGVLVGAEVGSIGAG